MSGGVGPTCNDISLPNEGIQGQEKSSHPITTTPSNHQPRRIRFLTLRQLNCFAVMTILAASGMVSPEDLGFVLFSIFYMYLLLKVAFPRKTTTPKPPMIFDPRNKILQIYVTVGAIIGLFLPVAYIFHGIFEGDKEGIKAAAPHVFLLASQVFMEGVAFSDRFSIPVRVYVPVFYNTRRIFTIVEWMRSEFSNKDINEYGHGGGGNKAAYVGKVLALANMAFWCFNLFCFLLPVYLPKAFKMYYSESTTKLKD